MQLINAILLATAATAATAHVLTKRCSPYPNPDMYLGYDPPSPCWHTHTTACVNHIMNGTEQYVSESRHTAVIFPVSDYCFGYIAEEQAREADGRVTWGWRKKHGKLTRVPGTDILVITEMTDEAVKRYKSMTY
ncbi:hypothetical protein RB597_002307 [Gaeumannomyces tritici]